MMKVFRCSLFSLILSVAMLPGMYVNADELKISSFSAEGELVFKTPTAGTADHHYRVECSTSLVNAAWTTRRSVSGVGALANVTNLVSATEPDMFYRVVSSSNSSAFVDGEYMVVDLSGGTGAVTYAVEYYSGASAVPGGVNSDTYKTTKLVLRKIPKGTFTMGRPIGELGWNTDETQHQVTLTKDFYIGVFEVTQRQWELVMGNRPSYFDNATYYATRPVEMVTYYQIRENPANDDDPAVDWPNNSIVNASSFMGKLRAKTGLSTFDLPTESQWEYACRAGTATALNTGHNLTSEQSDPRMDVAGRYLYNGPEVYGYDSSVNTLGGTAKTGSYLPNAWGLYDMHGNVWEWCLDLYGYYPGTVSDPSGAGSGLNRVLRGGAWNFNAADCRSAFRNDYTVFMFWRDFNIGFRVARTLP